MKIALLVLSLSALACASAEESDKSLETAINFVKDCKGDYILCVKVIMRVKVLWSVAFQGFLFHLFMNCGSVFCGCGLVQLLFFIV